MDQDVATRWAPPGLKKKFVDFFLSIFVAVVDDVTATASLPPSAKLPDAASGKTRRRRSADPVPFVCLFFGFTSRKKTSFWKEKT